MQDVATSGLLESDQILPHVDAKTCCALPVSIVDFHLEFSGTEWAAFISSAFVITFKQIHVIDIQVAAAAETELAHEFRDRYIFYRDIG